MSKRIGPISEFKLPVLLLLLAASNLAAYDMFQSADCDRCEQALSDIRFDPFFINLFLSDDLVKTFEADFVGNGFLNWIQGEGPDPNVVKRVIFPTTPNPTIITIEAADLFELEPDPFLRGAHRETWMNVIARFQLEDEPVSRTNRWMKITGFKPRVILKRGRSFVIQTPILDPGESDVSLMKVTGSPKESQWVFSLPRPTGPNKEYIADISVIETKPEEVKLQLTAASDGITFEGCKNKFQLGSFTVYCAVSVELEARLGNKTISDRGQIWVDLPTSVQAENRQTSAVPNQMIE